MKLPSITTRLFLAVLATVTLAVLLVGIATRVSFNKGFLGFLNDQAVQRMDVVLPRLREAYAEHLNWEFVRDKPAVWFGLIGTNLSTVPTADPHAVIPDLIATDVLGASRRMTLLDAQRQRVIGFPYILATSIQHPIVVRGNTVGWLTIAPIESVTDAASLRFRGEQLQAVIVTGVVAVLLSALIAWWAARALLSPVRRVAAATHRLAAGDYATRVAVLGQDEVSQLAQDFNQLALTLERNEQMRRNFMADVSHELRTPLALLRGELEAMEDGVHRATPEHLRMLQTEVSSLTQLVGDLHELALADVGALSYRKVELDVNDLLERELASFHDRAAEQELSLTIERPPFAVWLLADEGRLRQLLHNLLDNSIRYTDAGGRLLVTLRVREDWALLDVEDSAPGVAAELLPQLFERFYRVDRSRGRTSGGSGLGLAICRSIVLAHGGHIEAHQSPLGGVCIEVRLPLARAIRETTR